MRIFGHDYKVSCDKESSEMASMGRIHVEQLRIQIASNLPQSQKESTMLHEIIESIDAHCELGLNHQQICGLESGLYQILKDNGVDFSPLLRE
jgi:hypothetical protein